MGPVGPMSPMGTDGPIGTNGLVEHVKLLLWRFSDEFDSHVSDATSIYWNNVAELAMAQAEQARLKDELTRNENQVSSLELQVGVGHAQITQWRQVADDMISKFSAHAVSYM